MALATARSRQCDALCRRLVRLLCTTAPPPHHTHSSPPSQPPFRKAPSGVSIDRKVKLLTRARRFSEIETLLEFRKSNPPEDPFARELYFASIIASYGYAHMVDAAERTFEQMPGPRTAVALNALLTAYENSRHHIARVPDFFAELPVKHDIQVNAQSYAIVINALCEAGNPERAYGVVLKEMEEKGMEVTTLTYTPIISALYKKRKPEEAERVWREMIDRGHVPDITAYNVLAKNVAHHGTLEELMGVIGQIESAGLVPDIFTHNMLITYYCNQGKIAEARDVYGGLPKKKLWPNMTTHRILVVSLLKNKDFDSALGFCRDGLKKGWVPDFGSAKLLVAGLVLNKRVEDARLLVRELMEKSSPGIYDMLKKLEEDLLGAGSGEPVAETVAV